MKKLTALLLTAMMVLSLTACGGKETAEDVSVETTATEETAQTSEETAEESSEETVDAEETNSEELPHYIIAADITCAPFEFENDNGEMVGIDLDLIDAIAKDQGFTYEFEFVGFSAALTALETGECDMVAAAVSITDDRCEKYDFSDPYYDSGVGLAVLADSDIDSYEDLAGGQVGVKIGTESATFAESIADQYGFTVAQFEETSAMYQDVLAGTSVGCFDDYPVLSYEIAQRGVGFKLPLQMEKGSSYGFPTLKGENPELVQMLNDGLANIKASGEFDAIFAKYMGK